MQTRSVSFILHIVFFFLGPLLSNAIPMPTPDPHRNCQSMYETCDDLARNYDNTSVQTLEDAAKCHENNFSYYVERRHLYPLHEKCARETGMRSLWFWHTRAQLLFSRNVMDEEIRRIKRLDSDPNLLILWPALKNLQTEYLRAYAIWIDRLVAFNKIVTELDKSPNNVFPSNTIISTAFSRRGIEENIEDLSPFYDSWTHVFVASNNIEHTLGQYYRALDDGHSKVLLRYFVVQNDERSLEEIFAEAETAEAAAVRGKSEMKMAESLLFRFIHARKQSNHELLQIDKNRLNTLLSSQEWDKLKALLHWLLQEYVDLGHGGREDTRHTS